MKVIYGFVLGVVAATGLNLFAGDFVDSRYEQMKEFQKSHGIDAPFDGMDNRERRYRFDQDQPC